MKPGDLEFAWVDQLQRQARRRRIMRAAVAVAAPAVVILAAMAAGWLLCEASR